MDITAVNGIPIVGHQGPGSIAETTILRLLELQGSMYPSQIVSLKAFPGAENTIALPDHADRIEIVFAAGGPAATAAAAPLGFALSPSRWSELVAAPGGHPAAGDLAGPIDGLGGGPGHAPGPRHEHPDRAPGGGAQHRDRSRRAQARRARQPLRAYDDQAHDAHRQARPAHPADQAVRGAPGASRTWRRRSQHAHRPRHPPRPPQLASVVRPGPTPAHAPRAA